MKIALINKKVA